MAHLIRLNGHVTDFEGGWECMSNQQPCWTKAMYYVSKELDNFDATAEFNCQLNFARNHLEEEWDEEEKEKLQKENDKKMVSQFLHSQRPSEEVTQAANRLGFQPVG